MTPSDSSTTPRPPTTLVMCSSTQVTFSMTSSGRAANNSGRSPVSNDASATRAARFAERTDENVATARTSVPPAVASDEIVDQSAMSGGYDTRSDRPTAAVGQSRRARPDQTPPACERRLRPGGASGDTGAMVGADALHRLERARRGGARDRVPRVPAPAA